MRFDQNNDWFYDSVIIIKSNSSNIATLNIRSQMLIRYFYQFLHFVNDCAVQISIDKIICWDVKPCITLIRCRKRIYREPEFHFSWSSSDASILTMRGWFRSTTGSATMGNWGEAKMLSISSFSAKAFSKADLATLVTQSIRTTAHKPKRTTKHYERSEILMN